MQFSVRVSDYQKKTMLNICDAELLGKKIIQDDLTVNISESYYGDRFVDQKKLNLYYKVHQLLIWLEKKLFLYLLNLGLVLKLELK